MTLVSGVDLSPTLWLVVGQSKALGMDLLGVGQIAAVGSVSQNVAGVLPGEEPKVSGLDRRGPSHSVGNGLPGGQRERRGSNFHWAEGARDKKKAWWPR